MNDNKKDKIITLQPTNYTLALLASDLNTQLNASFANDLIEPIDWVLYVGISFSCIVDGAALAHCMCLMYTLCSCTL